MTLETTLVGAPPWEQLRALIKHYWGYTALRPLQEEAMQAVLAGRDSLVVLPTGGGKSLCYQAPAVLQGHTTVVISPLIALMKDQVDGLRACGIPAVQFDSSQDPETQNAILQDLRQGSIRLLYASPERLLQGSFCRLLQQLQVRTFAIDEAHCISHWGHDFRPEYRQMSKLKELFPEASFHAYTATATQQVRQDICLQLGLRQPTVLVGNFDRPNLTYRVLHREDHLKQVLDVLARHRDEAGIIYAIRRRDVDELTVSLRQHGIKARAYHAGLSSEERLLAQNAFRAEECDLIVATIAFGMGIDRSNVRFVLHLGMPKSLEHYQQETGRAGRDGLEAECVLLYSGQDVRTWKFVLEKSVSEAGSEVDPNFLPAAFQHIEEMSQYCRGATCRHRALVEYFGQSYPSPSCLSCDVCLGDTEEVHDATVVAQKILSCVARVKESFGITYVVSVLRGENTETVKRRQHDALSTFGLLKAHTQAEVRDWVYQLLGQKLLVQEGTEYPILKLNDASWEVLRGKRSVRLLQNSKRKKGDKPRKSAADAVSWEGVDHTLFEKLRQLRRQLAEEKKCPPYVIFGDQTLRELAKKKPRSLEAFRQVYGIGDTKLKVFGELFVAVIVEHAE